MTPERWREIERLYHAARERSDQERATFLAEACSGDHRLQRDVEALLAQPATALGFLEAGPVASADPPSVEQAADRVGQRIGPYEVLGFEGAGGMAEVYRARHTVLGRIDAIKILPPAFTRDPDRLARLKREARVLASLNHTGIATIYGFEEGDGVQALVMEFVDGSTLAERLAQAGERDGAPVPIREAFEIGRQIASALEAAHEKGIVHRDLKPANVKITSNGLVKVLDFGLAKAGVDKDRDVAETRAMSAGETRAGMILGTPAYMSPEQARGQPIDNRSDIWAFGCVLYELLTGRAPFARPTFTDTLAAIVEHEPDWHALPDGMPTAVVQLLHRCLDKDLANRLSAIGEARLVLHAAADLPRPVATSPRFTRRTVAIAAGAVVLAGAAVLAVVVGLRGPSEQASSERPEKISIAVLPFRTGSVSEPMRFLGVGIPDAIISQLAGIQHLVTRPTGAILRFENEVVDPRQAGRALVSDYVLTGMLQEAGDRLGVSVQLVRARDGAPVWGQRYDVVRSDLLPLQGQIAQAVAEALDLQVSAAERERLFRRYTVNARAYELYLQGRTELTRGTPGSTRAAVGLFEEVLTLDAGYVPAQAGVALGSALMGLGLTPPSEAQQWRERAEREARAALQRDRQLAEAHEALAAVHRAVEFDWESTIEESRRALALNPNLDRPRYFTANAFGHLGLLDLVEPEVQAGIAVNPSNTVGPSFERGWTRLMAGRFEEALSQLEEWNRLQGGNPNFVMGMAYYYAGDKVRAEQILASLRGNSGGALNAQALLASFLAARSAGDEARPLIKAVVDAGPISHHAAYSLGAAYAQLGEFAEARRWLADAARRGFPCYPWYARDPLLDPLRSDPQFRRFMMDLRASWQVFAGRYGATTG
jgi:TolB-like protein